MCVTLEALNDLYDSSHEQPSRRTMGFGSKRAERDWLLVRTDLRPLVSCTKKRPFKLLENRNFIRCSDQTTDFERKIESRGVESTIYVVG